MTDQSEIIVRKRRPEARPTEILEAALDLFTERGFNATRLEDVASRAGLSKAAIYLYFNDKTSLLTAVVQATVGANIGIASDMISKHQGPVAPLLRQLLGFMAGRMQETRMPDLIKLVISESRAHPEIGRFYMDNVINKALPLFQSLIERGMANGEFRNVDPRLTVKCLVGPMLLGAIWKSAFEPIGADPIDIVALANHDADLIIRALRP
ncbi:MAG TPA: TetR/AcrR family transcriptional regulator [Aestuariivirga sp.]|jgi:AcrR family transcriptional regulator|nr:TetR/AcrR family transcriptional regulator [Aestuariivirga sp.]